MENEPSWRSEQLRQDDSQKSIFVISRCRISRMSDPRGLLSLLSVHTDPQGGEDYDCDASTEIEAKP